MDTTKILSDYETSKEAYELGLRKQTVFSWHLNENPICIIEEKGWQRELFSAYTAEEVPLPFWKRTNSPIIGQYEIYMHNSGIQYSRLILDDRGFVVDRESSPIISYKPNEATARLKMALWLIENVPEAKKWYIKKGDLIKGDE